MTQYNVVNTVVTVPLHIGSLISAIQGFIQDFELGGEKQDGSRMIVVHESTLTHT